MLKQKPVVNVKRRKDNMVITELFNKPKLIGIVGNPNEAKSNLAYWIIQELKKDFRFNLYSFGFKFLLDGKTFNSIKELEQIKDSIIFIDEFSSLIDLEDRKKRKIVESTFRLLFHNNNIVILIGTGENFKKFIASKLDIIFYKKIFYEDLINGSKVKTILNDYADVDNVKGSSVLNLDKNQALLFDGEKYKILDIPYIKKYDSKKENKSILTPIKNVQKKC